MKRFACGDVIPGCTHTFEAEHTEDVLAQVALHAQDDHGIEDIDDATVAKVLAHITTD